MIADRKNECALFERVLGGEGAPILIVEGASERGKSTLLAEFASMADRVLGAGYCVRLDLKGSLPIKSLVSNISGDLPPEVLADNENHSRNSPFNIQVVAELNSASLGEDNSVVVSPNINFHSNNPDLRAEEILLNGLRKCEKRLAIIIDTFEAATEETANWIRQKLLPCVRRNPKITIVVGGQKVPLPGDHRLSWGDLALHHVLAPVTSIDDWHEFARLHHPHFPRDRIEAVADGGLTARPSIMQVYITNIVATLSARRDGINL